MAFKAQEKTNVLGIPISPMGVGNVASLFSSKAADESLIITFVNPHACYLDRQISDYSGILESFDIVACDGIGMVKAARTSGCLDLNRESFDFTSLAGEVLSAATNLGWRVGLVGGRPGVSESAATKLVDKFPSLNVVGCFSGYGENPTEALSFFSQQQVDLVICGMGAPLQERFLIQLVSDGWKGTGFTCGGFLDQTVDSQYSYPDWIDRHDLRFLYRLIKEPRRLWRRYLIEYQVFLKRYGQLQWMKIRSSLKGGSVPDDME